MGYRLTKRARRDLLEIWLYIAVDNETAADRFVDRLTRHFELLGDFPEAGRKRDDLPLGYRSFPVGQYLIFYKISRQGAQILHIVHGRMNLNRYPF